MAVLRIPDKNIEITDFDAIQSYLKARGVWHDRWQTPVRFAPDAAPEVVLAAYDAALAPYMQSNGYQTADVIVVHAETPGLDAIRNKFLREHTHDEDEVRFFVDGKGWFWFNANGEVFHVECGAGDLLSVPAGTPHWFDLGPEPYVKAIRIFIDASGWVPHYTESGIESRYLNV